MKINKEWHFEHPMPQKASFKQRAEWHLAHEKHCNCRPIPQKLLSEIEENGLRMFSLVI
jgi:hypothetical protein